MGSTAAERKEGREGRKGKGRERAEREFCCADGRTDGPQTMTSWITDTLLCVASLGGFSSPLPIINHDSKNGKRNECRRNLTGSYRLVVIDPNLEIWAISDL